MPNEKTVDDPTDFVEKRIERLRKTYGKGVTIVREDIREDENWWFIPIMTDPQPKDTYEFYKALSDIEEEIERTEGINVTLIPCVPDPPQ